MEKIISIAFELGILGTLFILYYFYQKHKLTKKDQEERENQNDA